ncbi:MAG TPA: LPS biosynthesis protein, partial [Flavobacterium sp.]|nr:LPS biosynthesis protein [Flavobacterium sp.]
SQIADQDMPQDVAFFSALYKFAKSNKISYIITGGNYSTESCREPEEWGAYPGIDKTLIQDIHRRYGSRELKTFPVVDIFQYKLYYKYILGMKVLKPLNLIPYIKADAEKLLEDKFGWQKFQHKHHESRFTRFYEDYWLPRKFGFDRRKVHFSSLILSGQMTREEALTRIKKSELEESVLQKEFDYVAEKLDFTKSEFQDIFEGENKIYQIYKNKRILIDIGTKTMRKFGMEKRLFR